MAQSFHTTIITGGSTPILRRRPLRTAVVSGPDAVRSHDFQSDRIVIGTHPSCDLALTDKTVSRYHCEIVLVPHGYLIRDLDSTNGTAIGSIRLGEVVTDGDVTLSVGETTVELHPLDDAIDIELADKTRFGPLKGQSPAMREVMDRLAKAAATELTVLITGESGTGKELAARAVHEASARAEKPFIVVDCGALPANLIESELYGHVRGAFTGATRDYDGAFRAANGGTLFLDELGELPLDLQTRLLGVLEREQVTPVGGVKPVPVDVRIVAATNRDLRRHVNQGTFREDLYFRLAVVTVKMPALRERPEDIELYARDFLDELKGDRPAFTLDEQTISRLKRLPWPGNVRELRNVLERAAVFGEVEVEAAPPMAAGRGELPTAQHVDISVPFKTAKAALITHFEQQYTKALIAEHNNNVSRAARAAEIDRVYLLRLLDKHGLRPSRK